MSFRDLFVFGFVFSLLPVALIRPFVGLLIFTWLAYFRAQDLCWGAARDFRFSFITAIVMIIGFFLYERKKLWIRDLRNSMMWLLAIWIGLSMLVNGGVTPYAVSRYTELLKIMIVAMMTSSMCDTKERLQALLWTVGLSLGFFGIKAGLWSLATGGEVLQGPGGMMTDNNDFSLALCMNLPILFYLGRGHPNRRVRFACYAGVFLTVITIMATNSRGGFLAMSVIALTMVLRSQYKTLGILGGILAVSAFLTFAPAEYRERLSSIQTHEDESSQRRLIAWRAAWKMALDHPVFGVGFTRFPVMARWYTEEQDVGRYEERRRGPHVAHNSYLQVLAESGFPALFFFFLLMFGMFFSMSRVRRASLRRKHRGWIVPYANLFEASMLGFMVGGTFLNRAHFDFFYHLIGMAIALEVIAWKHLLAPPKLGRGKSSGRPVVSVRAENPYLLKGL